MSLNSESVGRSRLYSRIQSIVLLISFTFFFVPLSFQGLSVNYSFVLFPLSIILISQVIIKPPTIIVVGIVLFFFIFFLASFYQAEYYEIFFRRSISFIIFLTLFSFSIIHIDERMISSFKNAIIIISVLFSLQSIVVFYELQLINSVSKLSLGSQRFGFIYLMSLWILMFDLNKVNSSTFWKVILIIIVMTGIFLTFSRSSIVALIGVFVLFALVEMYRVLKYPNFQVLKRLIYFFAVFFIALIAAYKYAPITFNFFLASLVNPLFDGHLYSELLIPESSEGIRLYRINEIIDYIFLNPLTGSGYLGIWAISETGSGSAHGQFIDVLLRVGVFGFMFYIYIGLILLRFLWKFDQSLFWGLMCVVVYGFFHETFKESQGAFLISFLLGVYSQSLRKGKESNQSKNIMEQ